MIDNDQAKLFSDHYQEILLLLAILVNDTFTQLVNGFSNFVNCTIWGWIYVEFNQKTGEKMLIITRIKYVIQLLRWLKNDHLHLLCSIFHVNSLLIVFCWNLKYCDYLWNIPLIQFIFHTQVIFLHNCWNLSSSKLRSHWLQWLLMMVFCIIRTRTFNYLTFWRNFVEKSIVIVEK